jgi:uncharacterized protein YwqG
MSIFKNLFGKSEPKDNQEENLDVHLSYLESIREPAIALSKSESKPSSKIGGLPNLPNDIDWPAWKEAPMSFLCQLDLSEIYKNNKTDLPDSGALYFFYNQEQETWGFDPKDEGSWKVIYIDSVLSEIPERSVPEGLSDEFIYAQQHIQFKPIKAYPDSQDDRVGKLNLNDTQFDQYDELRFSVFSNNPSHQLFGCPAPVQGDDMDLECQLVTNGLYCGDATGYNDPKRKELEAGRSDWKLLLQLDSDDDAEMMWGDCGMLYFWIKKQDLQSRNFDKCWMVFQCS